MRCSARGEDYATPNCPQAPSGLSSVSRCWRCSRICSSRTSPISRATASLDGTSASEENLPYLRGRLLFQQHVRENLTNRARFYVAHDEFNPNRPANRLIRSSLDRLERTVRNEENRRLLRELTDAFADVPPTRDAEGDWRRHSVDRTMQHYRSVMAWVRLFLFGQGLATFHGKHENQSLLFPMEEIYEDFVTQCFRRHQDEYRVRAQGPQWKLTRDPEAFTMKPDITLLKGRASRFILDAKWKRLKSASDEPKKRGISQADMYQLYAYGKRYECRTVALVYPRTDDFEEPLRFVFHDGLTLICLPFDVSQPEVSVSRSIRALHSPERPTGLGTALSTPRHADGSLSGRPDHLCRFAARWMRTRTRVSGAE